MDTKIVEAVGLATRPGHTSLFKDIRRFFLRRFYWVVFRDWIPFRLRECVLSFGLAWFRASSMFGGGSISNSLENSLLLLLFNATTIANVAINATSSPITNIYVSLHTADPGEAGNQTTSEASYTSYARVAVARTSGGWTITANSVSPVAAITFPAGTGGSGTATYFGIGTASSGSGVLWCSGTVTPNIVMGNTITPSLATATSFSLD